MMCGQTRPAASQPIDSVELIRKKIKRSSHSPVEAGGLLVPPRSMDDVEDTPETSPVAHATRYNFGPVLAAPPLEDNFSYLQRFAEAIQHFELSDDLVMSPYRACDPGTCTYRSFCIC